MSGRFRLSKVSQHLHQAKPNELLSIPGELGLKLGGQKLVEVPSRPGFVYVRLRNDQSEVVQAYNDKVSPIYGLPVVVMRDKIDKGRYYIVGRDVGRYNNWGSSPYLPRHGAQHSFNPDAPGNDITWVWSRQFTPLLGVPSGSAASMNLLIYPGTLYYNNRWIYAGYTGTPDLSAYKPTGAVARMLLVYMDQSGNPKISAGTTFDPSLTGTQQIFPYIPSMPGDGLVPVAGVRLVSGTSYVSWDNLYDLRQFLHWGVFTGTAGTGGGGSGGHTIQANGLSLPARTNLNFTGAGFTVFDDSGANSTVVSGTSSSKPIGTLQQEIAIGSQSSTGLTGTAYFKLYAAPQPRVNLLINGLGDINLYDSENSVNIIRQDRNQDHQLAIWNYNSGTTTTHEYDSPPRIRNYAAKGSEPNPLSLVSGSVLGQMDYMGFGTDDWYMAGMIRAVNISPATSNFQNSVLQFSFGNSGSLSPFQTSMALARQELYRDRSLWYVPFAFTTGSDQGIYYGNIFDNGSWRSVVKDEKIVFQKRISNDWVTQGFSNPGPTGSNQVIHADNLGRLTNNKRFLVNPYKFDATYPSVVIGAPTGVSIGTENYMLSVVSDEWNQPSLLGLWGYGPGWYPVIDFHAANGSLTGTADLLVNGDTVAQINFKGRADGVYATVGRIEINALADFYTSSGTVSEMLLKVVPPNNNANTINALRIRGQDVTFYEDIILPSGSIYLGDRTTNGSWRIQRSGNDLIFQRLIASVWTTKSTITG